MKFLRRLIAKRAEREAAPVEGPDPTPGYSMDNFATDLNWERRPAR